MKLSSGEVENLCMMSPPARGRGLKSLGLRHSPRLPDVAPCAGAWIEIVGVVRRGAWAGVAPCAGAWIEIV